MQFTLIVPYYRNARMLEEQVRVWEQYPEGVSIILVDDGMATGATMRAAVMALRPAGAERIVVAVPVADAEVCAEFATLVDRVVCVSMPDSFWAVGQAYIDFSQTSDEEVRALLGV